MKRFFVVCLLVCLLAVSIPAYAVSKGEVFRVANCSEWISLRKTASTSSERLAKIPKGGLVMMDSMAQDGFCRVWYDNQAGYVLAKYLIPQSRALIIGGSDDFIPLYAEPSTDSESLGTAYRGSMAVLIAPAQNGFFHISHDGTYGFAEAKYLLGAEESDGMRLVVSNCNSYISLRSAATTRSLCLAKIPLNAKVVSFGFVGNDMEYVCYNGQYGFVLSKYLTLIPEGEGLVRRASLELRDWKGYADPESITDAALLSELQAMILCSAPSHTGQCPQDGLLTLEMWDGEVYRFTRVTDGCPTIISEDGAIRNLSEVDSERFWEIFDQTWELLQN